MDKLICLPSVNRSVNGSVIGLGQSNFGSIMAMVWVISGCGSELLSNVGI